MQQANSEGNRDSLCVVVCFLAQGVYMAFYCFASTTICYGSDPAFAVWAMLGVVQAVYLLCASIRFLYLLCA